MGKSNFMFTAMLSIVLAMPVKAAINSYTLDDAIKKNLVSATITGRKDATTAYYGDCITLILKNKTGQKLTLNLENGRRLDCTNDSVQDMLVTQAEIFALLPSTQQEFTIYAMCSQKHNRSPHPNSVYHIGGMAESVLVQLTILIEKLKAQSYTGQQAVWVLTDDSDPSGITGNDSATRVLREFVTKNKGFKKKAERDPNFIYDYSFPKEEANGFTIEGNFDWQMPYKTYVSLYIYDNNGNKIKVIFQDVVYSGGLQNYHYKITSDDFRPGELYWVRMKANDKILREVSIKMD
jgi:hypothetical protein